MHRAHHLRQGSSRTIGERWMSLLAAVALVAFSIPQEQPLGIALRALVSQANTNVMFDEAAVAGKTASPLKMQGTLDEALKQLLEDTGLEWRFLNEATVVVGKPGTLPAPNTNTTTTTTRAAV